MMSNEFLIFRPLVAGLKTAGGIGFVLHLEPEARVFELVWSPRGQVLDEAAATPMARKMLRHLNCRSNILPR